MGLVRGEWLFHAAPAPGIGEIAAALEERIGLAVSWGDRAEEDFLEVPLLRQRLFEWEVHADRIIVHGFIPAHPYLWTQFDNVMTGLGATRSNDPIAWQPDASSSFLSGSWSSLTTVQRLVLRVPAVVGWRPFDKLIDV